MLKAQDGRVERSLIHAQQIVGELFDAPRDAVAVQRTHGVERFQDHQVKRALQNFSAWVGNGEPPCNNQHLLDFNRRVRLVLLNVNR